MRVNLIGGTNDVRRWENPRADDAVVAGIITLAALLTAYKDTIRIFLTMCQNVWRGGQSLGTTRT